MRTLMTLTVAMEAVVEAVVWKVGVGVLHGKR